MPTESEFRKMVDSYAQGEIDSGSFHEWFSKASLAGFSDSEFSSLANHIEGLLAEASHASWPESALRDELANVIRPSVSHEPVAA
jgi:hypothetical protein